METIVNAKACGATTEGAETAFADTENGRGKGDEGITLPITLSLTFRLPSNTCGRFEHIFNTRLSLPLRRQPWWCVENVQIVRAVVMKKRRGAARMFGRVEELNGW